jgi:flagellar L-ring protein precursor FlgH
MMRKLLLILASVVALTQLWGCASSANRTPLVSTPTTVRPALADDRPANPGSLFPAVQTSMTGVYRPLFEDRRARAVGDTLIVILNETTSASKNSGAMAKKNSGTTLNGGVNNVGLGNVPINPSGKIGLSADGATTFQGDGASTAANSFNGLITVTVIEVLSNGNMVVAGEKQVAVGFEEEIIRFGGTVNPNNLLNNTVSSAQVADARIEYRGKGLTDEVREPGWFTKLFFGFGPM